MINKPIRKKVKQDAPVGPTPVQVSRSGEVGSDEELEQLNMGERRNNLYFTPEECAKEIRDMEIESQRRRQVPKFPDQDLSANIELFQSSSVGTSSGVPSVQLSHSLTQITLTSPVDYRKLAELQSYLLKLGNDLQSSVNRYQYIREDALDAVEFMLDSANIVDSEDHRTWSDNKFFSYLLTLYEKSKHPISLTEESFIERFKEEKLVFDISRGPDSLTSYASVLKDLSRKMLSFDISFTGDNEEKLIASILDRLPKHDALYQRLRTKLVAGGQPKTLRAFLSALAKAAGILSSIYLDAHSLGMEFKNPSSTSSASSHLTKRRVDVSNSGSSRAKKPKPQSGSQPSAETQSLQPCGGCGHKGHGRDTCRYVSHPDYNTNTSVPFLQSSKGIAWKEARHLDHLSRTVDSLDGTFKADPPQFKKSAKAPKDQSEGSHGRWPRGAKGKKFPNRQGEPLVLTSEVDKDVYNDQSPYINAIVYINDFSKHVCVLLDTGALQASYVSEELAAWFRSHGVPSCPCKAIVCDYSGVCRHSSACFTFRISLIKDNNSLISFELERARVVSMPYDLIIGLPCIRKYKLVDKFAYIFKELDNPPSDRSPPVGGGQTGSRDPSFSITSAGIPVPEGLKAPMRVRLPKSAYLTHEPEADEFVEDHRSGNLCHIDLPPNDQASIEAIRIEGSLEFRAAMHNLAVEYSDLFLSELNPSSIANLPPMELKVKAMEWQVAANSLAPRTQSLVKEEEIRIQLQKLLLSQRVSPCSEAYYSQVHMAKPPGKDKYRFCIDFWNLNNATEPIQWPLPIIGHMLRRLGARRPKRYATLDMTSGYHQIPMHENSRHYTAFITFLGVFLWLCVPFGLKGAPAYFQKVISTLVLSGLMYISVELYIDDIIIHGQSDHDLLVNIRAVFDRFRQFNLKLSPKKCLFGATQLEYVGHVITSDGIKFSDKKKEYVVDFIRPSSQKDLKRFVGVVTYFCDHIRNFAMITKPLRDMMLPYVPKAKLAWTEYNTQVFEQVKQAVNNCPTLYFTRDDLPVFLHTDASDYGIGAYLFQFEEATNTEFPVAFLSKSLSRAERNWSTIDKEAFAIYFALIKFEYLLRDIHFVLRTDHANLTFINHVFKGRVKRWKLAIQDFSFDIEHIAGEKNEIADAFSRLILLEEPTEKETFLLSDEFSIPDDKYKLISAVHNSAIGHHGIRRTLTKLHAQSYRWTRMEQHVQRFIKLCPCCQKMSVLQIPIHAHKFTISAYSPCGKG